MTKKVFPAVCLVLIPWLSGCSCSKEPFAPTGAQPSEQQPHGGASRSGAATPAQPRTADEAAGAEARHAEAGEQSIGHETPRPRASHGVAPAEDAEKAGQSDQAGGDQPGGGTAGDSNSLEVIEPPRHASAGPRDGADPAGVAAGVRRRIEVADDHARRQEFGEACRELLKAYDELNAFPTQPDAALSRLKASVTERLADYADQANQAADTGNAGSESGKPLMLQ